jgi:hypothetical protein
MYTSPLMQNTIIDICGDIIQEEIIRKVNVAQCFAVLDDETTDAARVEQMSISVRYIDKSSQKLCEEFLEFVPAYDLTGQGLATLIIGSLIKKGFNMQALIGQGYDGAATMSGHLNGVRDAVQKEYPLALYVHCVAHSLNLALSNSCGIPLIRNTLGIVKEVQVFFSSSAQRCNVLKSKVLADIPSSRSKHSKLVAMCETRWVERHESIQRFKKCMFR